MIKVRFFDCSFFEDMRKLNLSVREKVFYTFLFKNQKIKHCGIYKISLKEIVNETDFSMDLAIYLLDRLENIYDLIRYNPITEEVAIKNWFRYDVPLSDRLKLLISEQYAMIEDQSLIGFVDGSGILTDQVNERLEDSHCKAIIPEEIADFSNDIYYQCLIEYGNQLEHDERE